MEIGDTVMLKSWCKKSGRPAIITEVSPYLGCVKIMMLDTFEICAALKTNLLLLEAA